MGQMRRAGLVALLIAGGAALSACGAAEMARDTLPNTSYWLLASANPGNS